MRNYIFICIVTLFFGLIYLNFQLIKANEINEELVKELKECRETSFKRFEHARNLTDICDEFQSSRRAKNKYIAKHEIIN